MRVLRSVLAVEVGRARSCPVLLTGKPRHRPSRAGLLTVDAGLCAMAKPFLKALPTQLNGDDRHKFRIPGPAQCWGQACLLSGALQLNLAFPKHSLHIRHIPWCSRCPSSWNSSRRYCLPKDHSWFCRSSASHIRAWRWRQHRPRRPRQRSSIM